MRAIGRVAVIAAIVTLAGCSGDSGSSGDGNRINGNTGGGKTGSGGTASGSGGVTGNGFGNTGVNAPSTAPTAGAGGAAAGDGTGGTLANGCQVGMFCAPTDPDPKDCGTITLQTSVKTVMMPGNVLLIFDRSFSMTEMWNGMVKYQAAGTALISALMPLVDNLTIGGVMFPSETPGPNDVGLSCAVDPFTSPEQLAFQPGAMALQHLMGAPPSGNPSPMYAPVGNGPMDAALGATPTTEAIMAADVALQNATLTGATVAVLITDGAPNCAWDQAATTAVVQKWLTQLNIKTYVIGLPGVDGGGMGMAGGAPGVDGPTVLNAIAMAGGTDTFIVPTDSATLQAKLMSIVSSTVKAGFDSCAIDLTPAADPADKLQLVLTESVMGVPTDEAAPHDLGNGGGWTISDDGMHVQLVGSLCTDAMGGRFDMLKFTYGCKMLPPLPAEPPPS